MKYFTPDLILQFGSNDDAIANAASAEWDRLQEVYLRHLKKIGPKLPRSMRSLLKRYYLHDARVCTMAIDEGSTLAITLRLDGEGNGWLQLTYRLAEGPTIHPHPEVAEREAPMEWLYDEVGLVKGKPSTFQHNILFTNGRELEVRFHNVTVKHFRKLLSPGARPADEATRELELLAS
jgi:hypothetical protein